MKTKRDTLIITVCCLISILTLPNLTRTISEEVKNYLNKSKTTVLSANILVLDIESFENNFSKNVTLDEVTELIFKGENLYQPYRIYVYHKCGIFKVGNFTYFLLKRGEVKKSLDKNLVPFVGDMSKIPQNCTIENSTGSYVLGEISRIERMNNLKIGNVYFFRNHIPLFSFYRLGLDHALNKERK
jgi:hypothetical protein